MLRARIPALDRLQRLIERRALRQLEKRAHNRRLGEDPWRTPTRLWPDFGDD